MFDFGKYTDLIFLSYAIVFLALGLLTIGIIVYGRRLQQQLKTTETQLAANQSVQENKT